MLALKGAATPAAAIVFAPSSAITDADLSANTLAPSIDETSHALRIRAEYADGTTLKTAVIPFQPASTITVGATGADFTTIQAAWDSLKGRPLQSAVTIAVQSGTYTEAVTLNRQPFSDLITIQGDTRSSRSTRSTRP
jgi:pectin methylesterase-like acyl-CoA thioesterase